tara:strand:+ start:1522 stop:1803 length:282 start_codon:yes stop_codon:yes gene_type:complete
MMLLMNKKENKCETDQSKYTQVKTVYARAAIILLTANFCLTGYVLAGMMKIQDEQAENLRTPQALTGTVTATAFSETQATKPKTPQTLEKEDN